ncbi:general transcription factor IIF subunit 2 [Trichuris trichiura]|uniref:General transcription factor IIF subunit 2 n=1 Tax=Trichuris trichiura TaxID=36087 RepID=A0A077ZBP8_TRITR|nr:general transcription factor IIF subunit 2 [Trichuris trichiura]
MSGSNQLDCRHRSRGIWLVKVPKYLSTKWVQSAGRPEIGRIRVVKPQTSGGKTEVKFCLADDGCNAFKTEEIPLEHQFVTSGVSFQAMTAICEDTSNCEDPLNDIGKLSVVGRIVQKAECRPPPSTNYMKMKKTHIENVSKPEKLIKTMERAEVKFKPSNQGTIVERTKRVEKNIRLNRDDLRNLLFQAFEKHQYYRLVDLAKITQQPPNYLKDVLCDIAQYNTMPPHRYTWELKPEYRHYQESSAEPQSSP